MFRVIFEIHRRPELSLEEFAEHYRRHGPLVRALPGVLGHTQCLVARSENPLGPAADAISILDFDSERDYCLADSSPEMQVAHEDAASFVSHVVAYHVEPREVPQSAGQRPGTAKPNQTIGDRMALSVRSEGGVCSDG